MAKKINFNERKFKLEIHKRELVIESIQECIDKYKALNLEPLNNDEFLQLFNQPKQLLLAKLTKGKDILLGEMQIDVDKVFDLIQKPKGTVEILHLIENCKARILSKLKSQNLHYNTADQVIGEFELQNGENVALNKATIEKIRQQQEVILYSPTALAIFNFGEELLKLIKETNLPEVLKTNSSYIKPDVVDVLKNLIVANESKELKLNENYILFFEK